MIFFSNTNHINHNKMIHFFHTTFGLVVLIVCAWIILGYIAYKVLPKKKLCHCCKAKKTYSKDKDRLPFCDDCYNEQLYKQTIANGPVLLCPIHGELMSKSICIDNNNDTASIVHTCKNPSCTIVIVDKELWEEITPFLGLHLYAPNTKNELR